MLTRDGILNKEDRTYETLYIPEWQDDVCLQSLSGEEREKWQKGNMDWTDPQKPKLVSTDFEIRLVVLAIVDGDTKERLFNDADIPFLRKKNGAAINRCFAVAQRLSGIGQKEVDDLTKNSSKGQSEDSTSV